MRAFVAVCNKGGMNQMDFMPFSDTLTTLLGAVLVWGIFLFVLSRFVKFARLFAKLFKPQQKEDPPETEDPPKKTTQP